ncbi:MAG: hypothetical protein AB7G11_01110 [Phycisphaerales bacterium]
MRQRWISRALIMGIAALAAVLLGAGQARAQWGIWQVLQELHKPVVTGRAMKEYADLLSLRGDQRSAADDLLFAYEREQRRLAERFDKVSQSINDEYAYEDDQEVQPWRDVWPKLNRSFFAKSMKMNKAIMDDLKSLLDADQIGQWDRVARLQRRRATLSWGGRAGDRIDLAEIVAGLRLEEGASASLAGTLSQYEIDLDRELQARVKYVEDSSEAWFKMMEEYDETKWNAMLKDWTEVNRRIGQVNERYRRALASELPEAKAKEFEKRVLQEIYPKVYRRSHAEMVLDAAERLEGLDSATVEGLKGVRETYERESAGANEKWAQALSDQDDRMEKESNGQNMWWGDWRPEDPKVQEARSARMALDRRTTQAIRAMLTEEQRKKLPDRKWRPEWDLDAPETDK